MGRVLSKVGGLWQVVAARVVMHLGRYAHGESAVTQRQASRKPPQAGKVGTVSRAHRECRFAAAASIGRFQSQFIGQVLDNYP
jgi:hypothetical protein